MNKIENMTLELLDELEIRKAPIPIEKIILYKGLSIAPYNFGSNVSGALFSQNDNATIGVNPLEPRVRRRFTIAHELGHYLLHKGKRNEKLFVDKKKMKVIYRNEHSSRGELRHEREANAFAACLLMPKAFVKHELDKIDPQLTDEEIVKKLSEIFEVSQIAMSFRLAKLGWLV